MTAVISAGGAEKVLEHLGWREKRRETEKTVQ